jgi:hypothetical protein
MLRVTKFSAFVSENTALGAKLIATLLQDILEKAFENSSLAVQRSKRLFSLPRALFTGLSKRDSLGKFPRRLTTARLKMDLDGRGDSEENWAIELENLIFPAFLRVSKRESLA